MRNSKFKLLVMAVLMLSFLLSTQVFAATWKSCSAPVSTTYYHCYNTLSGDTTLARFSNTLVDRYKAASAYQIYHSLAENKPTVTRGSPVYKNFYLVDNKQGKTYTYSSHNGKYLNDYSSINTWTGKYLQFYPSTGQRPTTNMEIKSGDPWACSSNPLGCKSYYHANELNVR